MAVEKNPWPASRMAPRTVQTAPLLMIVCPNGIGRDDSTGIRMHSIDWYMASLGELGVPAAISCAAPLQISRGRGLQNRRIVNLPFATPSECWGKKCIITLEV